MMRRVWQESSVEKFGAVNEKRKEVGKDETTRGESLRDLQRFFKKYDENKGYAGLRRIADEDGTAVWTILKEAEVAAQLEQRTKERREEERRHEKIFSAVQARAPSEATAAAPNEVETLQAELKAAHGEAEAAREKAEVAETARGEAEASAVRCPIVLEPGCSPDALCVGELTWMHTQLTWYLLGYVYTQATLQAKLDKAENKTNASTNADVPGVELQFGQVVAPKPSSGCCSML